MNRFDIDKHHFLPVASAVDALWLSFAYLTVRTCAASDTGMINGVYQEYGSSG